MKILILGMPRSGTSSLSVALGKALNYKIISEPFNYSIRQPDEYELVKDGNFVIPDNCVLKTIVGQIPLQLTHLSLIEFYDKFILEFDKIILISRIRTDLLLESYCQAEESGHWHSKWVKTHEFENIDKTKEAIDKILFIFDEVVGKYDIPVTWYEELYSGDKETIEDILRVWNIPNLNYENINSNINPKNKYRQADNFNKRLI